MRRAHPALKKTSVVDARKISRDERDVLKIMLQHVPCTHTHKKKVTGTFSGHEMLMKDMESEEALDMCVFL